jgi:hypothetical protein
MIDKLKSLELNQRILESKLTSLELKSSNNNNTNNNKFNSNSSYFDLVSTNRTTNAHDSNPFLNSNNNPKATNPNININNNNKKSADSVPITLNSINMAGGSSPPKPVRNGIFFFKKSVSLSSIIYLLFEL